MTIDGINFNKLPKKTDVNSKTDKEAPKGPSVEPEMTEEEKTALQRLRDSALAGYVLGLMKVTGGVLGVGATAASLQSCIEQNQDVDVDMAPILEKLDAMMKLQQQQIDQQTEMLNYLKEMNSDNKQLISLVESIIDQGRDITSILQSINGTVESIDAATIRIVALLEDANANDAEFLAKLDAIINGQADAADKLNQILQANKEQNQTLINLEKLLETLNDTNKNLYNKVIDFYNEYQNGDITKSEMLENILNEIKNNGSISSDILATINSLAQKFENGQITESELLNQIINLLASIDSKLDGLKDAVDQIKTEFPDLAGKIDEFIQKYEQGSINEQELLRQIIEEMKNVQGGTNPDFNTKLDEILAAINTGNMTISEAMDKVIELLGKIEANTGAILEAINKLAEEVDNLNANFENNQTAIIDGLANINDGIGSINSKLDQVIENQEENNQTTLDISQKMDELYAQVAQINDKTLTIDQVQEMFGPMYEEIKDYLSNISGNQITIGDIKAALEAHKTDLTRTNALLETVVSLLSNGDFEGGEGIDPAGLKEIADAIKEFQQQSNNNTAQKNANLEQVHEKLAGIQGSLDAIVTTGEDIKNTFDRAISSATTYGERLFNELQKISGNMVNKTTLQVYLDSYTEYLQKAEQARQQQFEILQAILTNMGKGDSGMTVDELKEIIPDYTDILNEISDKIGNLVTTADLEAYFENSTVDLTRTNALLETLVSLVSGLDTSGVNSSKLNSTLNEILNEVKSKKAPSEDQIQTLIDLVQESQTQTRSAGGDYYHQGWRYN